MTNAGKCGRPVFERQEDPEHGGVSHQEMADVLTATGNYRVLKRLPLRPRTRLGEDSTTRRALFLDVETTGLDPGRDEVIELAMVPFSYGLDGASSRSKKRSRPFVSPKDPYRRP